MKKNIALFFALLLVISTALVGCGSGSKDKSKSPSKGGNQELNLAVSAEIPTLDISKASDSESFRVLTNTNEGLVRLGENGKVEDGVAEDIQVSDDKLTYTFKLRDSQWSNGEAVTAKDFLYSFQRLFDPKTASQYAFVGYDIKNAEKVNLGKAKLDELGVTAPDDKTLVVTLERPIPYFLELMAFPSFYPLNQKYVEAQGSKFGLEADTTLYNGPFVLSEWKHDASYKLSKNDKYWDKDTVKLSAINYKIVKDVSTQMNLYETNQIDRVGLSAEDVDRHKDSKEFSTDYEAAMWYIRFNQKDKILANKNVREAINLAVDKETLTDVILNNGSTPASYIVPKNLVKDEHGKDFREINGMGPDADKKKAASLWKDAQKELKVSNVKIELLNTDTELAKKLGEYLKEQIETTLPGLTVDIKQQPFAQKLDLEDKMEYQMTLSGWSPDYPDPTTFLDLFLSNNTQFKMGYANKAFDKLILDAKNEKDFVKRTEMLAEAEKIVMDDQVVAPIYQRGRALLTRPYVKDVYYNVFGGDYTFKWASIKE